MYKNVNDYELLYLVAENDEDAYNDIFKKYKQMVHIEANKIYKKCGYLGISIDDFYQAGYYGLCMAINNFDEQMGVLFYTYANKYIVRELQTLIRDNSRYKHSILSDGVSLNMEIDEEGNTLDILIAGEKDIINKYEETIKYKKIIDFKYSLSFLYSLIFELRMNNFNNIEIANLLDIKYKTVDNAIMSIKNKLKKELNKIELSL